jgi:hypothetical protein
MFSLVDYTLEFLVLQNGLVTGSFLLTYTIVGVTAR